MADEADIANDLAELALQQALIAARNTASNLRLTPRGTCYNCEESLEPIDGQDVKIFCDADCADDWERVRAAQARNGR